VFLLVFMLVAAPLASYIPLATLAAVLAIVAWNMAEKHEFATLVRSSRGDAVVVLATFLLTVFRDLTEGIVVGFALGAVLFIHRMSEVTGVEAYSGLAQEDRADESGKRRGTAADLSLVTDPDVVVYRITGAFFFGAAATVSSVLNNIADRHKVFVVDFAAVPFLDSTAANAIYRVALSAQRKRIKLIVTGASPTVRRALLTHGVKPPLAHYRADIASAVDEVKGKTPAPEEATAPQPASV
jgi:SulP family sulfate permease